MIRELVRLRNRNQLTLPSGISEKLGLKPGSLLELIVSDEGHVEIRHARVVTSGTPEAHREEARAEEDIRQGRYVALKGSEDARDYMRQQRSQQAARKLAEQLEALQERMQCINVELNDTQVAIRAIGAGGRAHVQEEKVR